MKILLVHDKKIDQAMSVIGYQMFKDWKSDSHSSKKKFQFCEKQLKDNDELARAEAN